MLTFILIAAVLIILCVAVLVIPMLRGISTDAQQRHNQNIEFARERLTEIEEQLAANAITEEDYQSLRQEIESTLAADLDFHTTADDNPAKEASIKTSNAVLVTLLCCLLPILTAVTYLLTGDPEAIVRQQTPINEAAGMGTDIDQLVKSLETRLKTESEDVQGWTILARTYRQLGRNSDAAGAYRNLTRLQPGNADVWAGFADALAAANQGSLTEEALGALGNALEIDSNHPQSLWLSGLSRLQSGDNQGAIDFWRKLQGLMQGFPEQQAELERVINETGDAGGISLETAETASSNSAADTTGLAISVTVSLEQSVAEDTSPEDAVFVIAKAQQGPPAPLAVKRVLVKDLPLSVTLTENDAMLPQLSIAQFPNLELVARVSRSGQPTAQSGDLESAKLNIQNTEKNTLELVINRVVE